MNLNLLGFILSSLAGISTLIGFILVLVFNKKNDNVIIASLSFAAGVMSFLSFLDLIPEGIKFIKSNMYFIPGILVSFIFISIGILTSIFIDKIFPSNISYDNNNLYKVGVISMIGIIIHNIPEGIATFVTLTSDIKLGFTIALAIALHNIPEGISISLPIYYATCSKKKAFMYTFLSGLSEPFGAILAYFFLAPFISNMMLGILFSLIAGIMIHISLYELLPTSLKYKKYKITWLFYILGVLFVIITSILF